MDCMELNTYLCGVLAASIVGNIFWFLKWCAVKGKLLETLASFGVEVDR